MNSEKLIIFDTTMRDGEQSPGASMSKEEKVRIARALEKLGVDVMEAGFAISSDDDFAAIQAVAHAVRDVRVCSLARCHPKDIERAAEALRDAQAPRIHVFIATSSLHMRYKLQMSPEQVQETAVRSIRLARNCVEDVEFSCEDASRSERDFLCRIIEVAIEAGATTINIPDTVGYGEPEEFGDLVRELMQRIPNADKAVFSVHCHNDLGLATANSLMAVKAGARQVECTINGLGERAGNASLEEIVMTVATRKDLFPLHTDIDSTQIVPVSRLVSGITGFAVQPNKAIVGSNAFAHEAGIHQDGVIKRRETYEIMSAEDVGWRSNRLVLGKHSGRNALRMRLEELGAGEIDPAVFADLFIRFKELADRKHEIFDEDLQALLSGVADLHVASVYQLRGLDFSSALGGQAEARLQLEIQGRGDVSTEAQGAGPVDAVFRAIEAATHSGAHLLLYSVNAITGGADSQGEVLVRLQKGEHIVNGASADIDIVAASAKAYLSALNRLASNTGTQVRCGI